MICDAPPHGLEYHDKKYKDDYPQGSPDGLKLEPLIHELKRKKIHLSCMKLNKSVKPMLKIIKEIHDKCQVKDMEPRIKENGQKETNEELTARFQRYAIQATAQSIKHK